jgi:hypothetical protein
MRKNLDIDTIKKNASDLNKLISVERSKYPPDDRKYKAYTFLLESNQDFYHACISCVESSVERAVLIEKQIEKLEFTGKLHEEYHQQSARLKSSYKSAVLTGKRISNNLAILFSEYLSKEEKKGIRIGSFGKMLGKLQNRKAPFCNTSLEEARQIFISEGMKFESTIHKFRDDVIEHPRIEGLIDESHSITSDDRVDFEKKIRNSEKVTLPPDEMDPNWDGFVYYEVISKSGESEGHVYYVHAHLTKTFQEGEEISEGDPVMFVTDGDSGHFQKYGSHMHTYESPDYKGSAVKSDRVFNMPGVAQLHYSYSQFCEDIIHALSKI